MHAIYGLRDPRDQKVFYVGQTTDVYKRFIEHINCAGNNFERNSRIHELRALNLMVIMEIFELVEEQNKADEREAYWIRHFEQLQQPLTNVALVATPIIKLKNFAFGPSDNPNYVRIGLNSYTKEAVTITKEQFDMLLARRRSGDLSGFRQILKIFPEITEAHARNLNKMLLAHLEQGVS